MVANNVIDLEMHKIAREEGLSLADAPMEMWLASVDENYLFEGTDELLQLLKDCPDKTAPMFHWLRGVVDVKMAYGSEECVGTL